MKNKAKKKVTKTVAEKDIPQLSGVTIVQNRINKCVQSLGEFKPEEICYRCKFCRNFMLAKTPLDSKYRQMDAWEDYVVKNHPCPYINGIENEDGELEALKAGQDASECDCFELAWERVPQKLKDIIMSARASTSESASDVGVNLAKQELVEESKKIDLQLEQLRLQEAELRNRKKEIEADIEDCYASRFHNLDELINMNALVFGEIAGRETMEEDRRKEESEQKLVALGLTPHQKKVMRLVISVADIERIQATSKDNTYNGFFNDVNEKGLRVDSLGNTLASYAGKSFEFETELTEVAKSKGFRKQVIFQETEENFDKRQGISILEILCGNRRMRWREEIVTQPKLENMNDMEEEIDETEDGETEND